MRLLPNCQHRPMLLLLLYSRQTGFSLIPREPRDLRAI
jgi:hypothetical protein